MLNVQKESDLYPPMCTWLQTVMEYKYRRSGCEVRVVDASQYVLDKVLEQNGILSYFPKIVGLDIQIDVLGMAIWPDHAELTFIEAKKTRLVLRDLGQLWAYCKLCDPVDAYLLTSADLGTLDKVLNHLSREDMLDYGDRRIVKKMKVARWDITRQTIDENSVVPKI